jgi:hypothetical protein
VIAATWMAKSRPGTTIVSPVCSTSSLVFIQKLPNFNRMHMWNFLLLSAIFISKLSWLSLAMPGVAVALHDIESGAIAVQPYTTFHSPNFFSFMFLFTRTIVCCALVTP